MTDTEIFMTKENFQYELNIQKLEAINEKQDLKLKENVETITELQAQIESQEKAITENTLANQEKEETILTLQETINAKSTAIRILKTQVEEQKKVTDGLQADLLKKDNTIVEKIKRVEELETASLSQAELLFYYACKSDLILYNYVNEGKLKLTYDELKAKKIPVEFLEQVKKQPFETTNYVLTFSENIYQIKSRKK